jgi:hypothetical protein
MIMPSPRAIVSLSHASLAVSPTIESTRQREQRARASASVTAMTVANVMTVNTTSSLHSQRIYPGL